MFDTDKEILYQALSVWMNHIETGDVGISAQDAINMRRAHKINKLDDFQKGLLKLMDNLRTRLLKT